MSSMCARLWPVGRPRAPVEATHEGSLQLHTRHHIVDRGAGGTVSRSIRERFPGTRLGSLHDYEGSRFSRRVQYFYALRYAGTVFRYANTHPFLQRRAAPPAAHTTTTQRPHLCHELPPRTCPPPPHHYQIPTLVAYI